MLTRGIYAASVTALDPEGRRDPSGQARLLAHFAASGLQGVVLGGTNGEGPSLSAVDKRDLVRESIAGAAGLRLIAGLASNSLSEAIWLSQQAVKSGAAACLSTAPGYFREASLIGVRDWFLRLMDASPLPVLVYNFPKRVGIELDASFLAGLADHPNFAGAKDSSGQAENLVSYREAVGPGPLLFVGDETLLEAAFDAGWSGSISGAANSVAPWLASAWAGFESGDASARIRFALLREVIQGLRGLPNPGVHKAVLHGLGVLPLPTLALPLVPPTDEQVSTAWNALGRLGIRPVTG
jgi:4-hydroxy-tetrahydrodipicolinate synthase